MSIHEPPQAAFGAEAPPTPLVPHRFSVEQYHQMIELGILTTNDRVQLLQGVIAEMTPVGIPHSYCVQAMLEAIRALTPAGWTIRVQQPVGLAASEPEPDLSVVRGTYVDYRDHHPRPLEIGLLVEVADSSLSIDRVNKTQIYAAAGIREYWIVNLVDRYVEVRRDPGGGHEPAFQTCEIIPASGSLKLVLDGQKLGEIPVASILP